MRSYYVIPMAEPLQLEVKGLDQMLAKLGDMRKMLEPALDQAMTKSAVRIATAAKKRAPHDMGLLRNSISADTSRKLDKRVVADVFYAPFMEFGTGKFAAQYVATLPTDWATYAATFKGSGNGGNVNDFLDKLTDWVGRQGLAGTYSVKTRRRTGPKANRVNENREVAYAIMLYIFRNGIKPKPFLYPAFIEEMPRLEAEIFKIIKTFTG